MGSRRNLASRVIEAFGGVTKMSAATGIPISTVDSWQRTDRGIPNWRWPAIMIAAKAHKVALPDDAREAAAA